MKNKKKVKKNSNDVNYSIISEDVNLVYKKRVQILKDVSFKIKKGEIVALVGHNGCGKSTLIKCLTGVLKPTSGAAYINNYESFKYQKNIRNEIGVVFNQKPSFIVDLEVMDNFLYFKAIYNLSDEQFTKMIELADVYLNISSLYKKAYRKLSFGERVKCEITSVILHNPSVLIFDEPTIGLDYKAKIGFYNLLQYLNNQFLTTILIVTHDLDYIQDLCDKTIIMSEGSKIFEGSTVELMKNRKIGYLLTVNYIDVKDKDIFENLKQEATSIDEINHVIKFTGPDEEDRQKRLEKIIEGLKISEIKNEMSSFKEVFADVLQKNV